MPLLARLYSRRIVNINVNIIVAGLFALVPVTLVVNLAHNFLYDNRPDLTFWERKVIAGITLLTDIIADVTAFYILHWLANHWPRRLPGGTLARTAGEQSVPTFSKPTLEPGLTGPSSPSFLKDATLVQVERMMLSPLLYTIWLGTQMVVSNPALMPHALSPTWATVVGFVLATAVVRTIHTLWMLRSPHHRALSAQAEALAAQRAAPITITDAASASPVPPTAKPIPQPAEVQR